MKWKRNMYKVDLIEKKDFKAWKVIENNLSVFENYFPFTCVFLFFL